MQRPWISTNLAISADGKITSAQKIPSGWTSAEDHSRLVDLRKNIDALLIGRGTLETDRMTLTVPDQEIQPLRCIVSHSGILDPDLPIFAKTGGDIHLLVTGDQLPPPNPKVTLHQQDLQDFIAALHADHQVKTLHCEGGGQLIRALAELDLIDEFHLTLAGHTIFGGLKANTATGLPTDFLPNSRGFKISHFQPRPNLGECFVTYTRCRESR